MLVFKKPIFYVILAPRHKSSDSHNLEAPRRSCKVLPLRAKGKVPNLVRKEKKIMLRLLRPKVRESSVCEIVKKEKKLVLVLL
jgi:hypothetical protein